MKFICIPGYWQRGFLLMPVAAFRPESSSAAFLAPKYESSRVPARLKKPSNAFFLVTERFQPTFSYIKKSALLTILSTGNFGLGSYIWVKLQLAENLGFIVENVGKLLIFLCLPSRWGLEARTWHALNSRGWTLVTASDKNKYQQPYWKQWYRSHAHQSTEFVKSEILFQAWFCWMSQLCWDKGHINQSIRKSSCGNACVNCTA